MIKIGRFFREVFDSPATQPLLTLWIIGGATATMRASGWISYSVAALIITGSLIILVLSAFRKDISELHKQIDLSNDLLINEVHNTIDLTKDQLIQDVHEVIDSSKDIYINRIIHLTAILVSNNIEVPPDPYEGEPDE